MTPVPLVGPTLLERLAFPLACIVALLALGLAGWQWQEATAAKLQAAKVSEQFANYRGEQDRKHSDAIKKLRLEEAAAQRKIQEALDAERKRRIAAENSLRRSDAAAGGLRDELDATRARLDALDTTTAGGCQAAKATAAVCTGLLQQCSDRRRELARFAEEAATAGETCQRSYEALSTGPPP